MDALLRRIMFGFCATVTLGAAVAHGQTDGVWSNAAGGEYDVAGNWVGSTIANGAGATADFSQIDLNGDISVNVATNRTLGHLLFGDNNLATAGTIEFGSLSSPLAKITLNDPAPTITVNELTPTAFDDVFFGPYLSGANGFTKQGAGILTLAGAPDTINGVGTDLQGVVDIAGGTLRLAEGFGYYDLFNLVDPTAQTIDSINLQDGATLDLRAGVGFDTVTAAADATVNVVGGNGAFLANFTPGAGATLNVTVLDEAAGADQFSAHGDWTGFDTINVAGATTDPLDPKSVFRLRPNGGGFNTTGSFASTVLNLDNVETFVRSNSFGNNVNVAELHGTATSVISGGSNPGGVARWSIGANNADSDHAGDITPGSGGLSLIKVGTGTLTLSGDLSYSPVNTADGGQAGNPDRRGGITTVAAGTLALQGDATLPAGVDDTGTASNLGLLYATVDIAAGATLDVSGTTGTYSTQPLQQIIGNGTVVGDFTHDEGRLAPGDDNVGNSAALARTAGTLTFADSLTFSGGEILFDVDETPAGANDLIQVNGATTNLTGGGLVTPNFFGDVPSSGTYTILSSANGFTGNTSGWSVAWPGRGGSLPVSISGNDLVFDAAATTGATIVWVGNLSSAWNVQATQNFTNGGSPDAFFNGDDVTFNDTASSFDVDVVEDVQPLSMVVDSTTDYTIGGVGRIIGFASLTKRGSSTLTLTNNNTFTGAATIEGGTVDIGVNVGALGAGALTMSGGTIRASNAVTGGMTNTSLTVTDGTTNTIVSNGEPTNTATNPLTIPGLAGGGDLTVTTEVEGRLVDLGAVNDQFTGELTIAPSGAATTMGVRFAGGAGAGIPNGVLNVAAGATVNQRQNAVSTVDVGELNGDAGSVLSGFAGGGTATEKTWRIGNLGTDSTFAGDFTEGGATTNLTKVGGGELTLTGNNTYTGDTSIEGGVLSIDSPYLADAADVFLANGGTFNLDFAGTDTIDSLFIDGVSVATGAWGAIGSGAANTTPFITGTGILNVTTFEEFVLAGDYNDDGVVNAADYVLYRNGGPLANETASEGVIDQADFDAWSANYGATLPASAATAVPEPATVAGVLLALSCVLSARRRV